MPELPEVEITRLSFAERILNAQVLAAHTGKPLRHPFSINGAIAQDLVGARISAVRRRGKYLLMDLTAVRKQPTALLLLHLGMSGRLSFSAMPNQMEDEDDVDALNQQNAGNSAHVHFVMRTTAGTLCLHDPRRFGAVVFAASERSPEIVRLIGKLGMEPLEPAFSHAFFYEGLQKSRQAIKQLLLHGRLVVGVGNIYASESLHRAEIHPQRNAASLSKYEAKQLHRQIVCVLETAILQGGSTLKDFSDTFGRGGKFQLNARVYGRDGLSCMSCLEKGRKRIGTIQCIKQGQRSSFLCPICQNF